MKTSLILLLFFILQSCQKEGCNDPHARNYQRNAEGGCCCLYEGYLLFWHSGSTAGNLKYYAGVNKLHYFINEKERGTQPVLVYTNNTPDCGSDHAFTVRIDLGEHLNRKVFYRIMGDNGITYWKDSILARADTCFKQKLVFKK